MIENPYYILSPEEAMEELQIGRNAIYKLLSTGKSKGFKVGRNCNLKIHTRFSDGVNF